MSTRLPTLPKWVQEKKTYKIHCWGCPGSLELETLVPLDNKGNPSFESTFFVFLIKTIMDQKIPWHFEEERVTNEYGMEVWEKRFFCHNCYHRRPISK